jgi:hypothetical protein
VTDHLLMALGPMLLGVFALAYPDLALQPLSSLSAPTEPNKVNNAEVPDGTMVSIHQTAWQSAKIGSSCAGRRYRSNSSRW